MNMQISQFLDNYTSPDFADDLHEDYDISCNAGEFEDSQFDTSWQQACAEADTWGSEAYARDGLGDY